MDTFPLSNGFNGDSLVGRQKKEEEEEEGRQYEDERDPAEEMH